MLDEASSPGILAHFESFCTTCLNPNHRLQVQLAAGCIDSMKHAHVQWLTEHYTCTSRDRLLRVYASVSAPVCHAMVLTRHVQSHI